MDEDEDVGEYCGILYNECAICSAPFKQYGEEYCNTGCPMDLLDILGEYHEGKITRDEYLERVIIRNSNKEISTLASEDVTDKTKNIVLENVTDTAKNCTNNNTNIPSLVANNPTSLETTSMEKALELQAGKLAIAEDLVTAEITKNSCTNQIIASENVTDNKCTNNS